MTGAKSDEKSAPQARDRGAVLAMVLILALLLSAAVVSFTRRAVIDTVIALNHDAAAQAEALARGGVRLATALVVQDRSQDPRLMSFEEFEALMAGAGEQDTAEEPWAQVKDYELVTEDGAILRIAIKDSGSLLNLNAVVQRTYSAEQAVTAGPSPAEAEEFLVVVLEKVIADMPIIPGEKVYEPRELARNLLDYLDEDDQRIAGGDEDEYYLSQNPPYRAANRPLLSVEEVGLVEGFDVQLMQALRSYVTVYPLYPDDAHRGINLNTAPPHVLALVYYGSTGDQRLADEDIVRSILKVRAEGDLICTGGGGNPERCRTLQDVHPDLALGRVFPEMALPSDSTTFTLISAASVGEIRRTVVAVVDRSDPVVPQLLSWRMQ
jgi:general secretion pathway protein K